MTSQPFFTAYDQILGAELPPATTFLALRLLRLAHDTGTLCLEWADIMNLAGGVSNQGSVRRHLIALKQAGIIRYATNGCVHLSFCAYDAREFPRADAPEGEHEPIAVESAARGNPRATAHGAARTRAAPPPTPPYGCLFVDDPSIPETNNHVQAGPEPEPVIEPTEQQRSVQLLSDPDVGISIPVAGELATCHTFDWLERQVFAYLHDLSNNRVSGPGALINRIRRRWNPGQLTDDDRASDLYARHHDLTEERRNRYIPAEYADVIVY